MKSVNSAPLIVLAMSLAPIISARSTTHASGFPSKTSTEGVSIPYAAAEVSPRPVANGRGRSIPRGNAIMALRQSGPQGTSSRTVQSLRQSDLKEQTAHQEPLDGYTNRARSFGHRSEHLQAANKENEAIDEVFSAAGGIFASDAAMRQSLSSPSSASPYKRLLDSILGSDSYVAPTTSLSASLAAHLDESASEVSSYSDKGDASDDDDEEECDEEEEPMAAALPDRTDDSLGGAVSAADLLVAKNGPVLRRHTTNGDLSLPSAAATTTLMGPESTITSDTPAAIQALLVSQKSMPLNMPSTTLLQSTSRTTFSTLSSAKQQQAMTNVLNAGYVPASASSLAEQQATLIAQLAEMGRASSLATQSRQQSTALLAGLLALQVWQDGVTSLPFIIQLQQPAVLSPQVDGPSSSSVQTALVSESPGSTSGSAAQHIDDEAGQALPPTPTGLANGMVSTIVDSAQLQRLDEVNRAELPQLALPSQPKNPQQSQQPSAQAHTTRLNELTPDELEGLAQQLASSATFLHLPAAVSDQLSGASSSLSGLLGQASVPSAANFDRLQSNTFGAPPLRMQDTSGTWYDSSMVHDSGATTFIGATMGACSSLPSPASNKPDQWPSEAVSTLMSASSTESDTSTAVSTGTASAPTNVTSKNGANFAVTSTRSGTILSNPSSTRFTPPVASITAANESTTSAEAGRHRYILAQRESSAVELTGDAITTGSDNRQSKTRSSSAQTVLSVPYAGSRSLLSGSRQQLAMTTPSGLEKRFAFSLPSDVIPYPTSPLPATTTVADTSSSVSPFELTARGHQGHPDSDCSRSFVSPAAVAPSNSAQMQEVAGKRHARALRWMRHPSNVD